MIGPLEIIVAIVLALIFGYSFFYAIKTTKKNKKLLNGIKPIRSLNKKDTKAMHFIEIYSNLSVDPIPIIKINPKRLIHKDIWRFVNCDFKITSYTSGGRNKVIHHRFFTTINNVVIEVKVPESFIPFLELDESYKNTTIQVLYYYGHFTLFSIEGEIGYHSLYKKLTTNNGFERQPTKEELDAFMFSIWNSTWGLMAPVCLVMFLPALGQGASIIAFMTEIFAGFLLIVLLFLFTTIPFFIAYRKRKKYLYSRKIHVLKGTLWFDKKNHIYKINNDELKLHRKWKKIIKKRNLPINNVEIQALMHTYDNLDQKVVKQLQPVAIKSNALNLNETILQSTRSWATVFLYWLSFGITAYYTPSIAKNNIVINPLDILTIKEHCIFTLVLTLIWRPLQKGKFMRLFF